MKDKNRRLMVGPYFTPANSSPLENFSLLTETWADIVDMPVLESFASYLFMTINTVVPRRRGSRE